MNRSQILEQVVDILTNMTSEWDLGSQKPIGGTTKLIADLAFESIDVVQFLVAIQERFSRRDFPFEELVMADGRYVDEIVVDDVVGFLARHLDGHQTPTCSAHC